MLRLPHRALLERALLAHKFAKNSVVHAHYCQLLGRLALHVIVVMVHTQQLVVRTSTVGEMTTTMQSLGWAKVAARKLRM